MVAPGRFLVRAAGTSAIVQPMPKQQGQTSSVDNPAVCGRKRGGAAQRLASVDLAVDRFALDWLLARWELLLHCYRVAHVRLPQPRMLSSSYIHMYEGMCHDGGLPGPPLAARLHHQEHDVAMWIGCESTQWECLHAVAYGNMCTHMQAPNAQYDCQQRMLRQWR